MLKREDILSLSYLKKTSYSGSYQGIRYLLRKEEQEEAAVLAVYAWPEPYAFEHTPEEQKERCEVEFSEAGVCRAVDWLNEYREKIFEERA